MNMFAGFDENPAMTLQDIKETKRTDGRTDNMKTLKIKKKHLNSFHQVIFSSSSVI